MAIWQAFRRQSLGFWLLCSYFFLEYVRPQAIWPAIDVIPWSSITLVACAFAVLFRNRIRFSTPLAGLLGLYTVILVLSTFGAYEPAAAFAKWEVYVNWLLVFFLTVNLVDTEERFFVFLVLFLLWNFKMSQHAARSWALAGFAFRDWGVTGAPGWFHNSGEFGIQMTMFLPLSLYFAMSFWERLSSLKRSLLVVVVVSCVLGVIGSSSRGAYLGLAAAGFVFLLQTRRPGAASAVLMLFLLSALVIPPEQWERFSEAGEDRTSQTRLTYWRHGIEITNRNPVLGVGFNNWLPYYRDHYPAAGLFGGHQLPHNIFVEASAELGYSGLLAFLLLIFGTVSVNRKTRRLSRILGREGGFLRNMAFALDAALAGYLVSGFFVTVLYYPYFWVNLAMTAALHVAARRRVSGVRARSATAAAEGEVWRPSVLSAG